MLQNSIKQDIQHQYPEHFRNDIEKLKGRPNSIKDITSALNGYLIWTDEIDDVLLKNMTNLKYYLKFKGILLE